MYNDDTEMFRFPQVKTSTIYPQSEPEKPAPKASARHNVLMIVGFALTLLGGALAGYYAQNRGTPVPATVINSAPQSAPYSITYSGMGQYVVPGQVKPGTYMLMAGNADCSWERLKAVSVDKRAVITSGNVPKGSHDRLVVYPSDKAVRLIGPCSWILLGAALDNLTTVD